MDAGHQNEEEFKSLFFFGYFWLKGDKMSRYLGPVCKLCRREGEKLYIKGERCYSSKCPFERRSYSPGQHGRRSSRFSDFGQQLREKQKAKRTYGLLERQFRKYFVKAERQKGVTGDNLFRLLESRLDNVVYRLGFASSRKDARQLISHKHILVNDKRVNIPSYQVKAGDQIKVRQKSTELDRIVKALEAVEQRGVPEWLETDVDNRVGIVHALPTKEQIATTIQDQLIIEHYSR